MALQSSGKYIKGENTNQVVDDIISELKEMDKKEFESKQFISFKDQFQWFLGLGLLLLLIDSVVYNKKTKWIEKLNLFNENE
jgi:Ca-activated chloride channel family protein